MTAVRNHPRAGTDAAVKKVVPSLANPSKSVASPEMKLKMSTKQRQKHSLVIRLDLHNQQGEKPTANPRPQHKKRNDKLRQHPHDHRMPLHHRPIPRRQIQRRDKHQQPKHANRPIRTRVVRALGARECADEDDGDGAEGREREAKALGDHLDNAEGRGGPDRAHGPHDEGGGDVEGNDADGDGEPEEEGDDPVFVVAV